MPRRRADGPNQLWSWEITYLPTCVRGVWLYLSLVVDVWGRKIVAWGVLTMEVRLEALGVLRSFYRPRVSNETPYSEALIGTAQYRPEYPSGLFATG